MYVAVSLKGIEDITIKEINELLNVKSEKVLDGRILFDTSRVDKLNESKSIDKVYFLLERFEFKNLDEIYDRIEKINFKEFIKDRGFMVKCNRIGKHNFKSVEIEKSVGELIFNKGFNVELKNPDVIVYIEVIDNNCLVGILILDNLRKREYRLKAINAINSCLAYSLVRLSGFKDKEVLLDPFCVDGVVCIESCFCDGEIYGLCYSEHELRNSTVNAKLAGVYDKIKFLRNDLEWLSTGFKEGSIDRIVSSLISKKIDYREFFRQTNYILNKNGKIVLLCLNKESVKKIAEDFGFICEEKEVWIGEFKCWILGLNKKSI